MSGNRRECTGEKPSRTALLRLCRPLGFVRPSRGHPGHSVVPADPTLPMQPSAEEDIARGRQPEPFVLPAPTVRYGHGRPARPASAFPLRAWSGRSTVRISGHLSDPGAGAGARPRGVPRGRRRVGRLRRSFASLQRHPGIAFLARRTGICRAVSPQEVLCPPARSRAPRPRRLDARPCRACTRPSNRRRLPGMPIRDRPAPAVTPSRELQPPHPAATGSSAAASRDRLPVEAPAAAGRFVS